MKEPRDPDSARASESDDVDPAICCDRPYIYVVWEDERNGNEDIYYNWSADGGANFQTGDSRVSQDVPGVALDPSICCDGANVYIAWEDTRNGGLRDIYFDYSRDRGASWLLNDLRIDSDAVGSGFSNDVKLCCSGSNVYAIWQDQRDSPGTAFIDDIWFNVSNDGGITWRKDVRLNTNAPGTSESVAHKLCCSGDNVFATWVDFRTGATDIHMNWSTDAGHSFQIADLRVNTDTPGAPEQEDSWICCDGDDVYLAWGDHRDGNRSIRARGTR